MIGDCYLNVLSLSTVIAFKLIIVDNEPIVIIFNYLNTFSWESKLNTREREMTQYTAVVMTHRPFLGKLIIIPKKG